MSLENLEQNPKQPARLIEVIKKKPLNCIGCNCSCEEVLLAKGTLPDGIPHEGWSGPETIFIRRRQLDGTWRLRNILQPQGYIKALFEED